MPGTRSARLGRKSAGVDKDDTAQFVEEYKTIRFKGFNLQSLVNPAQIAQNSAPIVDDYPPLRPPPRDFGLRPRAAARDYTITPLAELAKPRPVDANTAFSSSSPASPASSSSDHHQSSGYKERTLRNNRQRYSSSCCPDREGELEHPGTTTSQHTQMKRTYSSTMHVSFDASKVLTDSPTWSGNREDSGDVGEEGLKSLVELLAIPGMQLVNHDGSETLLLQDEQSRPVALFSKQVVTPHEQERLSQIFEDALKDLGLVNTDLWHRRGKYFNMIFGISFGGGQQQPGNLLHSDHEETILQGLRNTPEVKALARRVDYLLRCYFPRIHTLYTNVLADICASDANLSRNWDDCCFAASSLNLLNAITVSHRDYLNLLFGQCAIFNCGRFNYRKGGHLVLWDLKLVVEFPPGCIALIPSAMIRHSNATIATSEVRHSLTFFTASGLFRWRHNYYMSDKDYNAGASYTQRMEWEQYRQELWQTGLDLLRFN